MAKSNIKKNAKGYGYTYTDLAQVHEYLEENKITYYQYIETVEGTDYVMTVPIIDGVEKPARRGCRVVQATLSGKVNPAQEQGSALTYARRYSLLMAFGLATTDDDAQLLTQPKKAEAVHKKTNVDGVKYLKSMIGITDTDEREFLDYFKVDDFAQLTPDEIMQGCKMLERKQLKRAKEGK